MIRRIVHDVVQSRMRRLVILLCLAAVLAAGCARQPVSDGPDAPGFLMGLVHGFIIMFSFVGGLFSDVRIYAYPNSGAWYDFGFLIGAMMFLGGGGKAGRRRTAAR